MTLAMLTAIAMLSTAAVAEAPPPVETPALSQLPGEPPALEHRLEAVDKALAATHLPDLSRRDAIVRATDLQAEATRLRQATVAEPNTTRAQALALEAAAGRMMAAAARHDEEAFAAARSDAAVALDLLRATAR